MLKRLFQSNFEKMRRHAENDIELDRAIVKAIEVYIDQEEHVVRLIPQNKLVSSQSQADHCANCILMRSFNKDLHVPHALLMDLLTSASKEDRVMYAIRYLWEISTFLRRKIVCARHGEIVAGVITLHDFAIVEEGVTAYNPVEEEKTWQKTVKIHEDFAKSTHHICASFRSSATQRVRKASAELVLKYNISSRVVDDEIARGREILTEQSPF